MVSDYSVSDLHEIFERLSVAGWQAILVGGQAVNLWCSRYASSIPQLAYYQPLVSRDLDFHGGIVEAKLAIKLLNAEGTLNSGNDPSPNAAVIQVTMSNGEKLLIDILTSIYGVSTSELIRSAVKWTFTESAHQVDLRVIHPILLTESKLACYRSLPQNGRQDVKHANLMSLVLRAWLLEQLLEPRRVFKGVERIVSLMQTPDGLNAYTNNIDLWNVIPLDEMRCTEGYEQFFSQRLKQMQDEVNDKRTRYLEALK
jgi:hypothetical protein